MFKKDFFPERRHIAFSSSSFDFYVIVSLWKIIVSVIHFLQAILSKTLEFRSSVIFCFRVKNWALKFGVDLWEFGRHFTKMNQIQNVSKTFSLSFQWLRRCEFSPWKCGSVGEVTGLIGRTRLYKTATRVRILTLPPSPPAVGNATQIWRDAGRRLADPILGYTRATFAVLSPYSSLPLP